MAPICLAACHIAFKNETEPGAWDFVCKFFTECNATSTAEGYQIFERSNGDADNCCTDLEPIWGTDNEIEAPNCNNFFKDYSADSGSNMVDETDGKTYCPYTQKQFVL